MVQEYDKYTENDHKIWSILYNRQMDILPPLATEAYLDGIQRIKFQPDQIPDFRVINEALMKLTGWSVYAVPGLIDNKPFFEHLYRKEFPAATWMRRFDQLNYIEEPDMFHDVFGHVPLLSEPFFCDYLNGLSKIALEHIENPTAIELIARIYWYTVEFGLIQEGGKVKIYGAGILSSPGESVFCVSEAANHIPYDVQAILDVPYIKDRFQSQYFVIDSYESLYNSLSEIETKIEGYVMAGIEVAPSP